MNNPVKTIAELTPATEGGRPRGKMQVGHVIRPGEVLVIIKERTRRDLQDKLHDSDCDTKYANRL
jgi:hypothetical protein